MLFMPAVFMSAVCSGMFGKKTFTDAADQNFYVAWIVMKNFFFYLNHKRVMEFGSL